MTPAFAPASLAEKSWAHDPDQYKYWYPLVWAGELTGCVITEGKCMLVTGSDVGAQDCFNFACADTSIQCPPEGLPECPGGAGSCDIDPGTEATAPEPYARQLVKRRTRMLGLGLG